MTEEKKKSLDDKKKVGAKEEKEVEALPETRILLCKPGTEPKN